MSKAKASICVMIATTVTVMALFFWPKPAQRTLQAAVVTVGELTVSCMLEGHTVYGGRQVLLSPVNGRVAQCYAFSGERVAAGDLILRMDSQADEAALAALESQFYQLQQTAKAAAGILPAADLLLAQQQQRLSIRAAIESKQIRTDADGIVENLYVQAGEYVAEGTPLGQIRGEEIRVTATWSGDSSLTPAAGMRAYWCAPDGTPQSPLLLESVSISGSDGYLLTFSPLCNAAELPGEGEAAPVQLVMKELPAMPLIPTEALDEHGCVWIIENGRMISIYAETGTAEQGYIQAVNLTPGTKVILHPDRALLAEGEPVRSGEHR